MYARSESPAATVAGAELALGSAAAVASARCAALKGGGFVETAGASTWVTEARFHAQSVDRRAKCEVTTYVNPQVFVGIVMPAIATDWNGRYVFRGCGESCGSLWAEGGENRRRERLFPARRPARF